MKLLMIYCNKFAYKPTVKTIEDAEVFTERVEYKKVQAAFIQVEEQDEIGGREKSVEKKLLNFVKWILRKNDTNEVVLHSFAHLSDSKASPEFTKALFDKVETRLKNVGYNVSQTPFGYFLDLEVDAPGFSLARVFKSFE